MLKKIVLFILLFFIGEAAIGKQAKPAYESINDTKKIQALNTFVDFINESTHGMLIVVKLLENFNLDINKYVDLASYKINQYNNDDLPKDIFKDEEHWFYEVSPYELYDKAVSGGPNGMKNYQQMLKHAGVMKNLTTSMNQVRFDLENLIKNNDLTVKDNLNKVYAKLEDCVMYYESFYQEQLKLEALIKTESVGLPVDHNLYKLMTSAYTSSKETLQYIRSKESRDMSGIIKNANGSLSKVSSFDVKSIPNTTNRFSFNWNNLTNAVSGLGKALDGFAAGEAPTEQYTIYGSYYYHYNVSGISKFNRYGTGIVVSMNQILLDLGWNTVKFTELPHYFKVIYPQKLEKVDLVVSSTKEVVAIPKEIKARKVKTGEKKMRVSNDVIEVMIYDHMIADGDVASVNFNGDWLFEKEELELAPKKYKLKINRNGQNYLLLHADNIGNRPPCTIGISYQLGGSKREITLSSDLNTSELIEIELLD